MTYVAHIIFLLGGGGLAPHEAISAVRFFFPGLLLF